MFGQTGKIKAVKTPKGTIHYSSKQDYLQRSKLRGKPGDALKKVADAMGSKSEQAVAPKSASDASKVDLSDKAKAKAKSVSENIKSDVGEVKAAGKKLFKEAGDAALTGLKYLPTPPGLLPSIGLGSGDDEVSEVKEVTERKVQSQINQPGIFFISGMQLWTLGSMSGNSMEAMAENIPGADAFSYRDHEEILAEIKRRPVGQPIILVGHSFGGDTAVEIAKELNTMENGFRKVDLLITMDSVGFDNDIIPINVRKNLNFIGDRDAFFNDGPNIARNTEKTDVVNELRSEDHTGIDDSEEVQFKVFEAINELMTEADRKKFQNYNRFKSIIDNLRSDAKDRSD